MAIQVTYRRTRRQSIPSLAVLPDYRRQGIAHCLLHATKEKANKMGQPCVGLLVDKGGLLVDKGNPAGEALYDMEGITKGVCTRTVQMDIQIMRSDKLGYNAPIEVYDRIYYRYADLFN